MGGEEPPTQCSAGRLADYVGVAGATGCGKSKETLGQSRAGEVKGDSQEVNMGGQTRGVGCRTESLGGSVGALGGIPGRSRCPNLGPDVWSMESHSLSLPGRAGGSGLARRKE